MTAVQTNKNSADVIVIGGGVTGLSAAWWLARSGVSVLLLEKSIVGWEASGRNGGGTAHYYSPLFAEEQRLWPQLDELLGYPTEWRPDRLNIALTESQSNTLSDLIKISGHIGKDCTRLDRQQLREHVPFVSDAAVDAVLFKFGGHANPHRTSQAYAWAFQDLGGRIAQHTRVEGFGKTGNRVHTVRTNKGDFQADQILITAGPQTGLLAGKLGLHLPLQLARVEMMVTAPVPLMKVGATDGNGLYGRQTLRGNLAYGGGPHEWLAIDPGADFQRPTTPLVQHIAKRVFDLFPKLGHVPVIRSWAGVVENTPDGRPVLDRSPIHENVTVGTMSSVGFGLSPASGRALAELVVDRACSFCDVSSFKLARFDGIGESWAESQGWAMPSQPPLPDRKFDRTVRREQ